MIDTNKIRGIMAERGVTGKDVAKAIGIHYNTFYDKLNKGVFGSDEIEAMIQYLDIDDPLPIFFTALVTSKVTDSVRG
jgi:hypothetical protein